jgi:predicted nucleic acid-binding protein
MVKVEMQTDEQTGKIKLAFESSDEDGLDVVDAVRVAMMGDHPKQGGYINSKRWVVEIDGN